MKKRHPYSILLLLTFMLLFNFTFSTTKISKIKLELCVSTDNDNRLFLNSELKEFIASKKVHFDTIKKAELKGNLLDDIGQAQEFVGISLYRSSDSTFVQGAITDSAGLYHLLNIQPDIYYLKASAFGFEEVYSGLIELKSGAIAVQPPLVLIPSVTSLEAVVITAKTALVERKSDRFIIKVKESALAAGTSLDLLKATPFVTLSSTNEVSLQGKKTLVLVDNKQIPDASVESILEMIPAGNIISMELITNPSAKYDAIYGAVINIITKKGQLDGYTGNVRMDGALGEYGQYGVNSSLTYTKGNFTTFGTVGYRKNDQMSFNKTKRTLNTSDISDTNREEVKRLFFQHFYSVQAGMQLKLDDNQTIGALITSNPSQRSGRFNSKNEFSKSDAALDSLLSTNSPFRSKGLTSNYNLNYHLLADSGKTELSMLTTYTPYRNNFRQFFTSVVFDENGDVIRVPEPYQTTNTTAVDIFITQVDFVRNFQKEWKLETGLKNQIAHSSSQILYEENSNSGFVTVPEYSNDNKLKETISAAYGILYKNWTKDKIQLGIRLENTDASYSGSTSQRYLKLFPTLFYQHDINDKYNLSFSYKKTITRTPYNELVPYTIFVNNYTVFTGNPQLKPQYDDIISLGVNLNKLNLSFNYVSIKGMFGQFPSSQDFNTGVTYFALQNLERSRDFYIDVFYPFKITSWWNTQNSGTLFGYSKSSGKVLGNEYDLSSTWYNFKTDHTVTFSKSIKLQVIANYSSGSTSELTHIGAVGNIDGSLLISILNNKGQIRIGASDILKRNVYRSDQYFYNYSSEKSRYGDSRRISVGFTYNFGKLSTKTPAKKLGNDDAINRIQ